MKISLLLFLWSFWGCDQNPVIQPESQSPGLWLQYKIIDVHAHIGSFQGFDLSAATLLENIEQYGIDKVLVSNIDGANLPGITENLDEIAANQATADTVKKYIRFMRGLLWTRPNDGAIQNLETFLNDPANHGLFVGMKFHPVMNQFAADTTLLDPYFRLCERNSLPAVFHSEASGNAAAQKIIAIAARFPNVPVVLYHMGFFGPHSAVIGVVETALASGAENLYVGTAQAPPEAILDAINRLGSDRVLFGSDATYYGKAHYLQYQPMITELRDKLSQENFDKVVRGNAIRVFGLE